MKGCKICGISDLNTLNYIINHQYPPQFIGFICNYKKSQDMLKLKIKRIIKIR
jgi:phosphoribosylanthranilate isomerase